MGCGCEYEHAGFAYPGAGFTRRLSHGAVRPHGHRWAQPVWVNTLRDLVPDVWVTRDAEEYLLLGLGAPGLQRQGGEPGAPGVVELGNLPPPNLHP
ncbi:hypothetical protein B9Q05_12545 [Candidatus Marsarchaeota G2 archaeon ECH_B_1]|uniref:Uncharacterized protein n=1 Tax=Candidatus Marsarchaeota G2 archaeon ECH_B_1 TaxID=1978159 RepID=A0A2R6BJ62_9ARCH|nr:MAG: hypothetical protein B9Q05_12545 [Candidatus Marsarchaeota G2 archaeon ECH_B_1]